MGGEFTYPKMVALVLTHGQVSLEYVSSEKEEGLEGKNQSGWVIKRVSQVWVIFTGVRFKQIDGCPTGKWMA